MEHTLNNHNIFPIHLVDQSVLVVDSSAPITTQILFKGLWLPNAIKRIAVYIFKQLKDSLIYFPVFLKPRIKIIPCFVSKKLIQMGVLFVSEAPFRLFQCF